MDPFLQLDVIGCNESLFPVRKNFNAKLSLAPQQDVGRLRKASHTRLANKFTLDVIAVDGIDEHFDINRMPVAVSSRTIWGSAKCLEALLVFLG